VYADADCGDRRIIYPAFDDSGYLRRIAKSKELISKQEYAIYCEIDYSNEMEALDVLFNDSMKQ